ncbi:MAG TPA: DUF4404 family protein [Syntrophorhabdaceae bacterium]|nr:DUF4404 family protein [Syntrophorhabdaceae bacterium]
MLRTTIKNIESKIENNTAMQEKDRSELLQLLSNLQDEIEELSKTDKEHAESIAGFAQTSTHEATRCQKDETLLNLSLNGLSSSVGELETSHPKLVETVNRISYILSNMGI